MQDNQMASQEPEQVYTLRLYVAGNGINSAAATKAAQSICRVLEYGCLEVTDILKNAQAARLAGLAIVPALVVNRKDRQRVFYGQLTDTEEIIKEIRRMTGE